VTTNIEHSVRARLQNYARSSHRPFQEVLQFYGLERFLYRFSRSGYSEKFLLKGALMLRVWGAEESRPTRDIDLLSHVGNEIGGLENIIRDACGIPVEDDGLLFDHETVTGAIIKEHADYQGARVKFTGFLNKTRIPMQIDIGFGDVVHPAAKEQFYPTLLEFPAPQLRMYPRETVIAEKFEAIVSLATANSRMKDFFDIWLLSRQFHFDGSVLSDAIARTFRNRGTEVEVEPVGLTSSFTTSETARIPWAAFLRKSNLESKASTLEEIRKPLREFLLPVAAAVAEGRKFDKKWSPPGPWR
jgi:Nucleotidyl transferase AbiEii toxin, Type IV TA system